MSRLCFLPRNEMPYQTVMKKIRPAYLDCSFMVRTTEFGLTHLMHVPAQFHFVILFYFMPGRSPETYASSNTFFPALLRFASQNVFHFSSMKVLFLLFASPLPPPPIPCYGLFFSLSGSAILTPLPSCWPAQQLFRFSFLSYSAANPLSIPPPPVHACLSACLSL